MEADLRFPIGKFERDADAGPVTRRGLMRDIADLPAQVADAIVRMDDPQLDTPYRPGGWTVRQTVHHIADSHLNSYCRFKLALTEDAPTIRPYDEAAWAELADSSMPPDVSLGIIRGVHARWSTLLDAMTEADFVRRLVHPETGDWTLAELLAMYAWHGRHHTAHITALAAREGWT